MYYFSDNEDGNDEKEERIPLFIEDYEPSYNPKEKEEEKEEKRVIIIDI